MALSLASKRIPIAMKMHFNNSDLKAKLALVSLLFALGISCRTEESTNLKIVGGKEDDTSYPAVVYLLINKGGILSNCTGTFISKTRILTAAHCVVDKSNKKDAEIKVFRSAKNLKNDATDKPLAKTKSFAVFSGYNRTESIAKVGHKDVAVLKLTNEVNIATMAVETNPPKAGSKVDMIGYGNTDFKDSKSNLKRNRHIASNNIGVIAPDNSLIGISSSTVSMTTGGVGLGDSGGPAIQGGKIIGIVSYISHISLATRSKTGNDLVSKTNPLTSWYVSTSHPEVKKFIEQNLK